MPRVDIISRTKLMRSLILIIFAVSACAIYGEGRVMAGTFGLSFASLRSSLVLISVFLFASSLLRLTFAQCKSIGSRVSIKFTLLQMVVYCMKYIFIVVASCIVAELYIELDEMRFVHEVFETKVIQCGRSRVWPFGGTSILYDEQRGFWATD